MIEYVCRWCGEVLDMNLDDRDRVAQVHRFCTPALVLIDGPLGSPEDLLADAHRRELARPLLS